MIDPLNANATLRYSVETVQTEAALAGLEDDWNRLSENTEHPNAFMTYGWFQAWFRQHSHENRGRLLPHVLVLRAGDAVAGIAPLVRRIASRFFRVRILEFATIHADYNDMVVGGEPAGQIRAVVDFLAQTTEQWDVVHLRDLRDTGNTIAEIESSLASSGLHYLVLTEKENCPYLPLDGNVDYLMKRLSGHVRRVIRKRIERAAPGGLRVRIVENPQEESELLDKLIALDHQKSLRSIYPPFIGRNPKVFQYLFKKLGPQGWLYVALLEQGNHTLAYQLGFRCGDKLWDYNKAYDQSYSRFAPGTLLLAGILDYGFERGFREYDFLRGEEPYKLVWSTAHHQRFGLLIWNRRAISQVRKFAYYDAKQAIRGLSGKRI